MANLTRDHRLLTVLIWVTSVIFLTAACARGVLAVLGHAGAGTTITGAAFVMSGLVNFTLQYIRLGQRCDHE